MNDLNLFILGRVGVAAGAGKFYGCAAVAHDETTSECLQLKPVRGVGSAEHGNTLFLRATVHYIKQLPDKDAHDGYIHVFVQSDYVNKGATSWINGWKANGWRTKSGSAVQNRELWEELEQELTRTNAFMHYLAFPPSGFDEDVTAEIHKANDAAREAANGEGDYFDLGGSAPRASSKPALREHLRYAPLEPVEQPIPKPAAAPAAMIAGQGMW